MSEHESSGESRPDVLKKLRELIEDDNLEGKTVLLAQQNLILASLLIEAAGYELGLSKSASTQHTPELVHLAARVDTIAKALV